MNIHEQMVENGRKFCSIKMRTAGENELLLWCDLDRLDSARRSVAGIAIAIENYRQWCDSYLGRLEVAGYYVDTCVVLTTPQY
jgi:hypothetical protein